MFDMPRIKNNNNLTRYGVYVCLIFSLVVQVLKYKKSHSKPLKDCWEKWGHTFVLEAVSNLAYIYWKALRVILYKNKQARSKFKKHKLKLQEVKMYKLHALNQV